MGMARGKFRGGFSFGSSVCFVVFSSFFPFTEGRCVSSKKGLPPSSPSSTASHFLSLLFGARISPSFSSFFQGVVVSCVFSSLKARRESLSSPSPLLLFSSLSLFQNRKQKLEEPFPPPLLSYPHLPSSFLRASERVTRREWIGGKRRRRRRKSPGERRGSERRVGGEKEHIHGREKSQGAAWLPDTKKGWIQRRQRQRKKIRLLPVSLSLLFQQ